MFIGEASAVSFLNFELSEAAIEFDKAAMLAAFGKVGESSGG